jgi:large subunit ribosomal protein L1
MPLVGRILGPVLGPRGKMPIPVPPTADIAALVAKHRKTIVIRLRNQPILQCRIGMENMKEEEIAGNIQAVFRVLDGKLKKGMKNVKFAYIKTAMGAPIKVKS